MNFPPHFTLEELTRSQTATRNGIDNTPDEEITANLVKLAWFLESLRGKLRKHYQKRLFIIVSSGYRCETLNLVIGGSKTSAHMKGLAADIHVPRLTSLELAKFINEHMANEEFDQVINEFGRWVHVGLTNGLARMQDLTAMKEDGKTIYKNGLMEA